MTGSLYVVATPIGNLEDITPRAVRVLGEADMIAAEDTRYSRGLLTHFQIKTPMFSCHKFNEGKRGDFFISALKQGKNVALISDAGTPCISDPGHRLVKLAAMEGFDVIPVCGASAAIAALSVSGFDVTRFSFVGFLPRSKGEIIKMLGGVLPGVAVFYESPRRIAATLASIYENFPTAQVCLCNDISKKFERVYHGGIEQVLREIEGNPDAEKGEYTCVFQVMELPASDEDTHEAISIEAQLVDMMVKHGGTLKDAAGRLQKLYKKKEIYAAMLRLKELL